ncbi:ABC-2 type transport system ATP-binding protein [Alkalihalobacillus xiaoxiensis]|uniref:ABC-2 type transport system ATP-binding protein n=1 Tax=Shouchella xiaoxiensis TaxID=766895 RepID=A0ABS2T3W2_9BACI|nr:ABC transporter ATP-binding protein [Shouchella xiaoxiensis]MBM7841152.1 ABC-2 type transport system ATP-binding protein [Shouchella xiaoxiensis]
MIKLTHVSKKYGRKKILHDVSFTVHPNEITCLVGINGVGKTTLLKMISNLTPTTSGSITIDQEPLTPKRYEEITFIPDTIPVPPSMTINDSIHFMRDFYSNWNHSRANDLLSFLKLNRKTKIGDLSKGNSAKVNLLLGLSLDVRYILMDEPFSGIDIFSREQITELFSSGFLEDRGILLTTHEIKDIEHLIDKAVLLDEGYVLKEFNTEDMRLNEGKSIEDVMREVYRP